MILAFTAYQLQQEERIAAKDWQQIRVNPKYAEMPSGNDLRRLSVLTSNCLPNARFDEEAVQRVICILLLTRLILTQALLHVASQHESKPPLPEAETPRDAEYSCV